MTVPLITLITTTGWRPKAFELCEKYIARQTYKGPVQWIVVSDDNPEKPTKMNMGQEYYQSPKIWRPGINTQRLSLDLAITKIKGDYIFIIEDDDWVGPTYIETYLDILRHAPLIGECDTTYYSLRVRGYKNMENFKHASLCQTAFKKEYLPWFDRAVNAGTLFVDIELWGTARNKGHKYILFNGPKLAYGMKGLPGRDGIGYGHTNTHEFISDPQFVKLKQLLGEDANAYIDMCK